MSKSERSPTSSVNVVASAISASGPSTLPDNLKPLQAEIEVYYHALPRLLESDAGRFAVVQGKRFWGAWDTYRDALQYGYERFGDAAFMVQKIGARDLEGLSRYFSAENQCPS